MLTPPRAPFSRPVRIWKGVRDPLGYLSYLEAKFGPIASIRPNVVAIFQPEFVKHVLQDNHRNYEKGEMYRAVLSPFMGNGLFTSEGAFWLRQRRISQGAFQRAHMPTFGDTAVSCMQDLAESWEPKAARNELIPVRQEITRLTLQVTLRNLFGIEASASMPELVKAVQGVNEEMHLAKIFLPVHLPKWFPTPGRRRFGRSLRTIDEFVYRVIATRKTAPEPGTDLVGLLLSARDPETGEAMDALQLRDELVTMVNAGHDTVTDSIIWTLLLLLRHPAALQRVREELDRAAPSGWPTPAQVASMDYLMRAFHEGVRLYPPGWAFARTALQEDSIGGYPIKPGSVIIVSPWAIHRSARFWERPNEFDPDRFLPNASATRNKFAYFPFGGGPRQCIGVGVAMMTGPIILASLLSRYDFSPVDESLPAIPPYQFAAEGRRLDAGTAQIVRKGMNGDRASGGVAGFFSGPIPSDSRFAGYR